MNEQEAVHTEEYKGYNILIHYDDLDTGGPREWDNFGTMWCWHRHYNLGDPKSTDYEHLTPAEAEQVGKDYLDLSDPEDAMYWIQREAEANRAVFLLIRGYEHGQLTVSSYAPGDSLTYPFNDRWDSGWLGFIFATRETILAEYGGKRLTKELKERALRVLDGEVQEFDDYLTGNVYGYMIERVDPARPECEDSCWGYYPDNSMLRPAPPYQAAIDAGKSVIDYTLDHSYSQLYLNI